MDFSSLGEIKPQAKSKFDFSSLGEVMEDPIGLTPELQKSSEKNVDPYSFDIDSAMGNLKQHTSSLISDMGGFMDRAWGGVKAGASNVSEGLGRLKEGVSNIGQPMGTIGGEPGKGGAPIMSPLGFNPEAGVKVLGGLGQIAATPAMAALGFVKPEVDLAISGYKQAYEQIPEGIRKPVQEKLKQVWDAIPDKAKETSGDVFWAMGLAEAEPFAKATVKGIEDVASKISKFSLENPEEAAKMLSKELKFTTNESSKFLKLTGPKKKGVSLPGEGVDPGKWLVDRGFKSTDPGNQLESVMTHFSEQKGNLDSAIEQLAKNPRMQGIKDPAIDKIITDMKEYYAKTENRSQLSQLNKRSELYAKDGMDIKQVNELKREYERNVRPDYVNAALRGSDSLKNTAAKNLDSQIRELVQEKASQGGFDNIAEMSKEVQQSKEMMNMLSKKALKSEALPNGLDFTDKLLIYGSGLNPKAIAADLIKKGVVDKVIPYLKEKIIGFKAGEAKKGVIDAPSAKIELHAKLGELSTKVLEELEVMAKKRKELKPLVDSIRASIKPPKNPLLPIGEPGKIPIQLPEQTQTLLKQKYPGGVLDSSLDPKYQKPLESRGKTALQILNGE